MSEPKDQDKKLESKEKKSAYPPRPNREEHDAKIQELMSKINACKSTQEMVKEKLDKLHEGRKEGSKTSADQEKLQAIRTKKKKVLDDRKALYDKQKAINEKRNAFRKELDDMNAQLKDLGVYSAKAVEEKVRNLEYYLSTTSLSLKEEKVVINDINSLNNSKRVIGGFDDLKTKRTEADDEGKKIYNEIVAIKKELDQIKEEEDAQYKKVQAARSANSSDKEKIQGWIEQRNAARKQVNELYDSIRKERDEFRKANDAWGKMMNERRKEQKEKQRREMESRKEEQRLQKLEDEKEEIEIEFDEKTATFDRLIAYLSKYTSSSTTDGDKAEDKSNETTDVKSEGLVRIGKATLGFDDDIFGTKKAGKKKKASKKKQANIVHDLECMQEFEKLGITPPTTVDAIPDIIKTLTEKRAGLEKEKEKKHAKRLEKIAKMEAERAAKKESEQNNSEEEKPAEAETNTTAETADSKDAADSKETAAAEEEAK